MLNYHLWREIFPRSERRSHSSITESLRRVSTMWTPCCWNCQYCHASKAGITDYFLW